ncbi:hypothetical protein CVT24_011107 [Panaeolus cyanescens]|uniref:Wax synthase domain-containing protein n=1 Tax=Panaeolus cyanescens TaxID=181874 RepID=A0A409YG42_9AGAR|nr:hypothetical protein CVT24_011107 [Panaeolus cyanescens]
MSLHMPTSAHPKEAHNVQWLAVIPILEIIHIISLSIWPSPYRPILFLPVVFLSAFVIFRSGISLQDYYATYAIGIKLTTITLLTSTDILLSEPQSEFRTKDHQSRSAYNSSSPFLSRLWWGLCVWINPRGINFAHEPKNLPPRPTETTNRAFYRRQIKGIVPYLILWELVGWLNRSNPYYYQLVDPSSITGYRRLWRLAGVTYWFHLAYMLSPGYRLMSIVGVALGLSKPRNWPDMFASPREAYTIRRFWGIFWHKLFRRIFTTHADFIASKLQLPKTGLFQRYFKTFVIFGFSGILHLGGDAIAMHSITDSGLMITFLLQAVAIMTEDGVLWLLGRAGLRRSRFTKMVGYVYVFLWFSWCTTFSSDIQMRHGYAKGWGPRISVIEKLRVGKWTYVIPDDHPLGSS